MSIIEPEVDATAVGEIAPRLCLATQSSRALPAHIKSYGPLWEPPAFIHPVYRVGSGWQIQRETLTLTPLMRARLQTAEADLLYGPAMDVVCDASWHKGKWNISQKAENLRWGGWYERLVLDPCELSESQLDQTQIVAHLPKQLKMPPARKPESSSHPPCDRIVPRSVSTSPTHGDQGSLDCYMGPLKVTGTVNGKEETTQERLRFEMFAACPLNHIVPGKSGHIFNAGGPVWSIDFLPGIDCYQSPKPRTSKLEAFSQNTILEYLALSTISEDPGLIPPSEMSKRGFGTKGCVQIWSVPALEPAILGCAARPGRWSGDAGQEPDIAISLQDEDLDIDPSESQTQPMLRIILALSSQATVVRWCPRGGSQEICKAAQDHGPVTRDGCTADGSGRHFNPTHEQAPLSCLGILAIATLDGAVGLYAPPDPAFVPSNLPKDVATPETSDRGVLMLKLQPRVKLFLPDTTCLTLDWGSHDVIAGGCTNGHVVIWHVSDALDTLATACGTSSSIKFTPAEVRPTHYISLHAAPVRSLIWIRTPPVNKLGEPDPNEDPTFLASTGYDGSLKLIDTEDIAGSATLIHERGETTSLVFSPTLGSLHLADSDYSIKAICVKPRDLGVSKKILIQLGLLWQLSTSDFHSFIAYAGADGTCGLASMIRPQKYKSRATMWAPKVYQMDYNRNSGELRMLDNLRPEPRSNDGTAVITQLPAKAKSKKKQAKNRDDSVTPPRRTAKVRSAHEAQSNSPVGIWPALVAVQCVTWCPSIRRASVLASGMACGLVRIDAVEGGWHGKGMRWGGIDELIDGVTNANGQGADKDEEDEDDLAD